MRHKRTYSAVFTREVDEGFKASAIHHLVMPSLPYSTLEELPVSTEHALFRSAISLKNKFNNAGIVINNGVSACQSLSHMHVHVMSFDAAYENGHDSFVSGYRGLMGVRIDKENYLPRFDTLGVLRGNVANFERVTQSVSPMHLVIDINKDENVAFELARRCRMTMKMIDPTITGFTYIAEGRELHVIPWRDDKPAPHSASNTMRVLSGLRTDPKGQPYRRHTFTPNKSA